MGRGPEESAKQYERQAGAGDHSVLILKHSQTRARELRKKSRARSLGGCGAMNQGMGELCCSSALL